MIAMQFMVKGFEARKIQYRLSRARSMGEFYPFHLSAVIQNDKVAGGKWDVEKFFFKEICRNDIERTLKIEFFELKQVKELDVAEFMAEFDFSIKYLMKHLGKYMNCFRR